MPVGALVHAAAPALAIGVATACADPCPAHVIFRVLAEDGSRVPDAALAIDPACCDDCHLVTNQHGEAGVDVEPTSFCAVTVEAEGFATKTQEFSVSEDDCRDGTRVDVLLEAAP